MAFIRNTKKMNCGPVAIYNYMTLINRKPNLSKIENISQEGRKHTRKGVDIDKLAMCLDKLKIPYKVKSGIPDRSKNKAYIVLLELCSDYAHWILLHKNTSYNISMLAPIENKHPLKTRNLKFLKSGFDIIGGKKVYFEYKDSYDFITKESYLELSF
jgi:hypothetical protein